MLDKLAVPAALQKYVIERTQTTLITPQEKPATTWVTKTYPTDNVRLVQINFVLFTYLSNFNYKNQTIITCMKGKLLAAVAILTLCSTIKAQERYRIIYDYKTDQISYYSLDKNNEIVDTLKRPKLKKGSHIELKLQHVNPFAVSVSTSVNEETVHNSPAQAGFNFGGLLGQMGSLGGDKLKLNIPKTSLQSDLLTNSGSTRGPQASNKIAELADVTENVSAVRNTLLSNLANPNMDKEQILQNLAEATKLYDDARLQDPNTNFYAYLTSVEKIVNQDKQDILNELDLIGTEVTAQTSDLSRGQNPQKEQTLRSLNTTVNSLETTTTQTVDNINEIKTMYAALEASSFEQIFDYKLGADKMDIEIQFKPTTLNATHARTASSSEIKKRSVSVISRGGIKINTGIALTMNNFGRSSKDFFISEDGVIGSQDNDYFTPNLSTMINFYPMISDGFNIGGSFGLSMPISEDISGVNFLFGPSIFLGSKNRLALSGGIAYGPIDRLSHGLKEGNTTEIRSLDNYTKRVYNFGYFVGISFSLININ